MSLKNRADYFFSKFLLILIKIDYYNNKVNFRITIVQHITLKMAHENSQLFKAMVNRGY